MDPKVTSSVRQILMNELGLTRELIREETKKIVAAEVEKVIRGMPMEQWVGDTVNRIVAGSWPNSRAKITEMVADKVTAEIKRRAIKSMEGLTVDVVLKGPEPRIPS